MVEIPSIADFRSPPVVEVVCGVQFEPLAEFRTAHIGLFWEQVRPQYPVTRDAFALPPVLESLGAPGAALPFPPFGPTGVPIPRVQLVDEQGGQMIQIQNGRFHHNWERRLGDEPYRRYKNIRPAFEGSWAQFKQFLQGQGLPAPRPTQYELSYVNHIAAGELWDSARGITDVLPWFSPPRTAAGSIFEPQFAMHVPVPNCNGRLHVSGQVGVRARDGQQVLAVELIVRGAPTVPGDDADLILWMDEARAQIVRTFVALTGVKARHYWGQTQ